MLKLAFCIANVSCTHSSLVCVFIKSFILCLVVFGLLMQEYDMAIVCYIVTIHQLLDKNAFFFWREEIKIHNLNLLNWSLLKQFSSHRCVTDP